MESEFSKKPETFLRLWLLEVKENEIHFYKVQVELEDILDYTYINFFFYVFSLIGWTYRNKN